MSRFPSAGHLASWAGTCPGSNESAGRIKFNPHSTGQSLPEGALGAAAMSVARSKNT
ncbi:MAG: transposase [Acidimicrobiales bacterium]